MPPRLPLLKGKMLPSENYRVVGKPIVKQKPPERNPKEHTEKLLKQLDAVISAAPRAKPKKIEGATRELISIHIKEDYLIPEASLADKKSDVRLVSMDKERGIALIDSPTSDLSALRKKILNYSDDNKINALSGTRRSEDLVAPIEIIKRADLDELAGTRFIDAGLNITDVEWFELSCRGGVHNPVDTANSRRQMHEAIKRFVPQSIQDYLATESVVFFIRSSVQGIREIIEAVDCVLEFDLSAPEIRDWLILETQNAAPLREFELIPPAPTSPSVVLLDTGVATRHPLLENAILSASSALEHDTSPEDTHERGHGTRMAGLCLYEDLGGDILLNASRASHWLQSVRILVAPHVGSASDNLRTFWPNTTEAAVFAAEREKGTVAAQVFAMAVTADLDKPPMPTFWSECVDRLAYNEGKGRLFCVSIGNSPSDDIVFLEGYPTLNLDQKLADPSQAENALTVGGFTNKGILPPHPGYATAEIIGLAGGISPHTRAGVIGDKKVHPIKPEVVFEAGNVARDGMLPNSTIDTLVDLTTDRNFLISPLTNIWATSAATAHCARFAAQVWKEMPSLRPETTRALIVHSASWTEEMIQQFPNKKERLAICGYGKPHFEVAIACMKDRATVFVEDKMPNGVLEKELKKKPPVRPTTSPYVYKVKRKAKFFEMPIPTEELLAVGDLEVELRVTLSFFPEPRLRRRKIEKGLHLKWDMQGPTESDQKFKERINQLMRDGTPQVREKSFDWEIGIEQRSAGTVQSDRWKGPASFLAGSKLIAVYPVLGWWDDNKELESSEMPFSLITTIVTPGVDVYTHIQQAIKHTVPIEVFK